MPTIATLTTTTSASGNVSTFTLHYKRNCEKIEETFIGNASQLEAILQQRSLENDRQKKHDLSDQKSQLVTSSLIKKVRKSMAIAEQRNSIHLVEVPEDAPLLKRLKSSAVTLTSTGPVVPKVDTLVMVSDQPVNIPV